MRKYIRYIMLSFLVFLVIAQFFPIDKTNPPLEPQKDFITMTQPSPELAQHLRAACYDCHSHEVKYPWYTSVAPISWWIKGHINNGVKHLNFSTWGDYGEGKKDHKLDECIEFVEKNWMPLFSYKIVHPEAKMTKDEREEMIAFFKQLKAY